MTGIGLVLCYRKEVWLPDRWQRTERAIFTSAHIEDPGCLSESLTGDAQNADKSISMPGRKPLMLRLCPQAAVTAGFPKKGQWVRRGSESSDRTSGVTITQARRLSGWCLPTSPDRFGRQALPQIKLPTWLYGKNKSNASSIKKKWMKIRRQQDSRLIPPPKRMTPNSSNRHRYLFLYKLSGMFRTLVILQSVHSGFYFDCTISSQSPKICVVF